MLRPLFAEVVAFGGVLTPQVDDLGARCVNMYVSVARAYAAIASLNLMLIERRDQDLELNSGAMAVPIIPSNGHVKWSITYTDFIF